MVEPEFLLDEVLEERRTDLEKELKELEVIAKQLENPKLQKDALFLSGFVRGMIHAVKPKEEFGISKTLQPGSPVQEIQKIQIPKNHFTIIPVKKAAEEKPKKMPEEIISEIPGKPVQKTLITDKFTGNILATALINSKYSVQEPELDEADRKALQKIFSKKPKTVDNAWKLIQKYGKKFRIQPGHENNIKYYAINRFFTLGKIEPLLHDNEISEIRCNGVGTPIVVTYNKKEMPSGISFENAGEILGFLDIVAERTRQKVDARHPILDAVYREFRIHVTFGVQPGNSKFIIKRIS